MGIVWARLFMVAKARAEIFGSILWPIATAPVLLAKTALLLSGVDLFVRVEALQDVHASNGLDLGRSLNSNTNARCSRPAAPLQAGPKMRPQ